MQRIVLGVTCLALLVGHGPGGCGSDGEEGVHTNARCDPRLRWSNFGNDFMGRFCTSCHSSELSGGHRRGAPPAYNYDTLDGVLLDLEHLDLVAAAGPGATNEFMPPFDPMPSTLEREQLGAWVACGAP